MKRSKPDSSLKHFFDQDEIFADLFNAVLFCGDEVIRTEELRREDREFQFSLRRKNGTYGTVMKYRDVVKKAGLGASFAILGIENQQKVHHAMPVRVMLYDALCYAAECNDAVPIHGKGDWSVDEILSNLARDTRISPVFTIVLYYGAQPWDGPKSLREMLEWDERLSGWVPDYPIRIVEVGNPGTEYPFRTRELSDFFFGVRSVYHGMRDSARVLSGSILQLIGIVTNSGKLLKIGKGGDATMSDALDKLVEEGREKGIKEGKKEGKREGKREGKKETQIAVASAMLKDGMEEALILKYSGLSAGQLSELRKNRRTR